jgi:hypothetical protein
MSEELFQDLVNTKTPDRFVTKPPAQFRQDWREQSSRSSALHSGNEAAEAKEKEAVTRLDTEAAGRLREW